MRVVVKYLKRDGLLSDILILEITVFQIWKFEPSVPFLVATIAAKDTMNVTAKFHGMKTYQNQY
jgi:hypothetical protein